jgi:hypothetical protein
MKLLLPLLAIVVVLGARPVAQPANTQLVTAVNIDEPPPPEPVDCPLCGGNAQLHMRLITFVIDRATTRFLGFVVCGR